MAARSSKSKKPSAGSGPSPSLPEPIVLFLDENLCNSRAILEALKRLNVPFERHLDHFLRGAADEDWLPIVGKNGWVLLTCDKEIRPCSKSTKVSEAQTRSRSCSRVTASPARSSRSRRTWYGCGLSLSFVPCLWSSRARVESSKGPNRYLRVGDTIATCRAGEPSQDCAPFLPGVST